MSIPYLIEIFMRQTSYWNIYIYLST